MADPIDLSQGLEIRIPFGPSLGVYVPAKAAEAEREELSRKVAELTTECDRLREENRRFDALVQSYLASIYAMTRQPVTFEPGELEAIEKSGLTLDQIIAELEKS